ncbi:MAG: L-threonylcarbamoyladenylate synthase [Halobacteria archaeon]|nr:L-threonylcarbamoyladenylate synthase [Halobacteria archaeon]
MSIEEAVNALRRNELVIYPTETVYGIGGDALNEGTVEKVFKAKKRPFSKPISMGVSSVETARRYTEPGDDAVEFMREFLPGPVTPIVPKTDEVPDVLTAGSEKVGIRVPDDETALELLGRFEPITSTSANISGGESARRVDELDEIREKVEVVIDAGECQYGQGSTVVDTTTETWEVVREGAMAGEVRKWMDGR